jgi:hypothetical protein
MAIYRLLQNSAFGPEEIARLSEAYEGVSAHLRLTDRTPGDTAADIELFIKALGLLHRPQAVATA